MPNAYGKTIDKTYLSVDNAEERGFIHRDYLAHCFRWTHIVKYLQEKKRYATADILDLGCGKEYPLLKTLYTSRMLPLSYIGVDYGPINPLLSSLENIEDGKCKIELYPNTNILNVTQATTNTIVMLEALEHMEKEQGTKVLEHIYFIMPDDAVFFLSTPVYDGVNKAGNHVYEWMFDELYDTLYDAGFKVDDVWGTFASIKDYKPLLTKEQLEIFTALKTYYDVNMLSCIFAPLFPKQSRNCLWQLIRS